MKIVVEIAPSLSDYARIPISFHVTERLDLTSADRARIAATLPTRPVTPPFRKDYDARPNEHPTDWPRRHDLSTWIFFAALIDERRVGGAAVIIDPAAADLATLYDIRIDAAFRRRGVGRALLTSVESETRARGVLRIQVETQDINVPACRFYACLGYQLAAIHDHAYPDLPDEAQLLWQKQLTSEPRGPLLPDQL